MTRPSYMTPETEETAMRERDRERQVAASAERKAKEARGIMSEQERLEAEAKGKRTASDVKTAAEELKDR